MQVLQPPLTGIRLAIHRHRVRLFGPLLLVLLTSSIAITQAEGQQAAPTKRVKRPPAGPIVTIYTPEPTRLELALDELDLDWSRAPGRKSAGPAQTAMAVPGTSVIKHDSSDRARFAVGRALTIADIQARAAQLEAANPGAQAEYVFYEPGQPKGEETRRLLTSEVGLVLQRGTEAALVSAPGQRGAAQPVRGVPDGYVVQADDPFAALALADDLRQDPRVVAAYPLLKRRVFPQ